MRVEADLVEQTAVVEAVHNDANAAGDRQLVGYNPSAWRRDIVPSRSSQPAHGCDHWLIGIFLKIRDGPRNIIRSEHFAPGRIHFEHDGLHCLIFGRDLELVLNQLNHVSTAPIPRLAGDDSFNVNDRNFVVGVILFDDDLLQ